MRMAPLAVLAAVAAALLPATPASAAQAGCGGSYAWVSANQDDAHTWPDGQITYANEWSGDGAPEQMCADSPSDVAVTSGQPAGNTAVESYPAVQYDFPPGTRVSSLKVLRSYYTETQPQGSPSADGPDNEFASDDWADGNAYEVMTWMDNQGQAPAGARVGTASLAGSGTFAVYDSGGTYFAFVRQGNLASGYIAHLAAWQWLIGHGYLPAGVTIGQEEIGWEICGDPPGGGTYTLTRNNLVIRGA